MMMMEARDVSGQTTMEVPIMVAFARVIRRVLRPSSSYDQNIAGACF